MTTAQTPGPNGSAVLASARSIVRSRSVTCGPACRADPCTLRQIRYAERALDAEPSLVVWAELGVLAHLVGEPMPVPRAGLLDGWAGWDPQHRECAVSHAVDAAVAVRTVAFATRLSPGELALHVNDAMNRTVISDESGCDLDRCRGWRIPRAGVTSARMLTHGYGDPSALESSVGCRTGDAGWSYRLAETLKGFADCRWPIRYLVGGGEGAGR